MLLSQAVENFPDAIALVTQEENWSYRELDSYVNGSVALLLREGVKKGDSVVLALENSREMIVLILALWRMGVRAFPLSHRFPRKEQKRYTEKAGAKLLITSYNFKRLVGEKGKLSLISFSRDDEATILLSSGTTSQPKTILHTLESHYQSALGSNRNIPLEVGDRWKLSLPLCHVGGLAIVVRCLVAGATIVLNDTFEGVTHASMVHTQLYRFLQEGGKAASLKAVLLGGSAFPDKLIKEAFLRGLPIYKSYGSTEMASQITTTEAGADLETLYSSGKLLEGRQLTIAKDGEILVRGKTAFKGYLGANPHKGWFRTKDRGRIDERGNLHHLGRKDRMFISGGENIQPEEIEKSLLMIPSVLEAEVSPKPDQEFGQRATAKLRCKRGSEEKLTKESLKEFLDDLLPRFKHPKEIIVEEER